MQSAAIAIAWEFRHRHRWGLRVLTGYLFVLAMIRIFVVQSGRIHFNDDETFALCVVVPLSATFIFFLAVFTFGLAGDLAARQSIYPARMFTLPLTNTALVAWPMLYGTTAITILWLATRLLAVWPLGVDVPIVWPALLAASLLAWTQALTWMPYALPGLRVILTIFWLAAIDAVVMLALNYKASEVVMLAILAPHVPLAFLVARSAVSRARRGDVPDWRGVFTRLAAFSNVLSRGQNDFASPLRAQTWFEWRRHGKSLPAMVAIVLPFELALLFLFRDTPSIVIEILFAALLTPAFMAAFAAATVNKSNPDKNDFYGLASFTATRPLSNGSLIAAKLKSTIWSTLAAWLVVLIALPIALKLSGTSDVVFERMRQLMNIEGKPRAVAMLLLGFSTLLVMTWKQLVKSLYIGMSGREWIVKGSVFVALSFLAIAGPLAHWILGNIEVMAIIWNTFAWIAAIFVCFKISAAVWIAIRLRKEGLFSDRKLLIGAVCWDAIVFALYGLLAWSLPAMIIRRYVLVLIAILSIPLARLSAAPLALAWNRHGGRDKSSRTIKSNKKMFITALLILIILPVMLALIESVSFHIHNRNNGSIVSAGEKREYTLYVPKSYDHSKPTALVISMHGAGGWPVQQMELSGWNELAEKEKFIVVYPAGAESAGPRVWHVNRGEGLVKDVRFISELIDKLEAQYNIDPQRIYANGLSNGGGMSFALSCTLSNRIAAVGMVGAALTLLASWCTDHRAVPMIAFHGTADSFAPYNGGASWIAPQSFPNIRRFVMNWARKNGCDPNPMESTVATDVIRREYTNCTDHAAVVLYTLRDGGHTWPGGRPLPEWFVGSTNRNISATSQMWAFFQAHPLARK